MGFISSAIETLGPAEMVLKAILGSLLGILLLVGFIVLAHNRIAGAVG